MSRSTTEPESGLVPSRRGELTAREVEEVLSFEDIRVVNDWLKSIGWTPELELQMLMDIIQNTNSESVRLRALKDFRDRRNEMLKNSGLIVKATKTKRDGEGSTVFSAEVITAAFPQKRSIVHVPKEVPTIPKEESTSGESPISPDSVGSSSDAKFHRPPTGSDPIGKDGERVGPETNGNIVGNSGDRTCSDISSEAE